MKFGDKIKEQRSKRGIKQDELAKALNITVRTLIRYEQNLSHPQNREIYRKLADYFEMDINFFLTEDEEFLTEAARQFGRRGASQAEAILEQTTALFAGGDLSEEDKLAFLHEMQQIYFDSKERAKKKFTPKKFRKTGGVT
jgi:transcriptional regulator with XRE-family HTH domain